MDIPNTFQQGVKAAQYGNPICARSFLEQASSEQPDHADMWVWMAWASYSPTEAIEFIDRAESLSPGNNLFRAFRIVLESLARYECTEEATLGRPTLSRAARSEGTDRTDSSDDVKTTSDRESKVSPSSETVLITPNLPTPKKVAKKDEKHKPTGGNERESDIPAELQATAEGEDVLFNMEDRQRLAELAAVEPLHVKDENMDDTPVCEEVDVAPAISPPLTDLPLNEAATQHITQTHSSSPIDSPTAVIVPPPPPQDAPPPEEAETQRTPEATTAAFNTTEPTPPTATVTRPRSVLIIAENLKMQNCLSEALAGRGIEVTAQAQLGSAIQAAQERKPGLIVLDAPLQQGDAIELSTEFKSNSSPDSAILLLSQQNGVFDRIRAKMAGCDEFLAKPLPMEDFVQAVERQIGLPTTDTQASTVTGVDSAHSSSAPSERLKRPASIPTV